MKYRRLSSRLWKYNIHLLSNLFSWLQANCNSRWSHFLHFILRISLVPCTTTIFQVSDCKLSYCWWKKFKCYVRASVTRCVLPFFIIIIIKLSWIVPVQGLKISLSSVYKSKNVDLYCFGLSLLKIATTYRNQWMSNFSIIGAASTLCKVCPGCARIWMHVPSPIFGA